MLDRVFFLAFCFVAVASLVGAPLSAEDHQPGEPRAKVQIELWMAELDFAKLRALNLTWDNFDENGQSQTTKILDILEGKEKNAALLQQPGALLDLLRRAGVAHIFAEPTLVTLCGRKATLEAGPTKLEVTPQLKGENEIAIDLRAEVTEPLPRVARRVPPGNRQMTLSTSVIVESGKAGLLFPIGSMQLVQPADPTQRSTVVPIALLRVKQL